MNTIIWMAITIGIVILCIPTKTEYNYTELNDTTARIVYCKHQLIGKKHYTPLQFERATNCDYDSAYEALHGEIKPLTY